MKIEIHGLDQLLEFGKQLEDDRDETDGRDDATAVDTVLLHDLFDRGFMQLYTDADSVAVFFGRSPWCPEREEDFREIPDDELDAYVTSHTQFENWEEMIGKALEAYLDKCWNARTVTGSDSDSRSE